MEEYYRIIEEKIAASGYPGHLSGEDIYNDICDEMENKEPGTYLFLSKKGDDFFIEYKVQVMEEQFNLSTMDIHTTTQIYRIDFDA